jgi:Lon protease-like protein
MRVKFFEGRMIDVVEEALLTDSPFGMARLAKFSNKKTSSFLTFSYGTDSTSAFGRRGSCG